MEPNETCILSAAPLEPSGPPSRTRPRKTLSSFRITLTLRLATTISAPAHPELIKARRKIGWRNPSIWTVRPA